jgi:hypothetical protein
MKFLLHKDIKEIAKRTKGAFGFDRHTEPSLRKTKRTNFPYLIKKHPFNLLH